MEKRQHWWVGREVWWGNQRAAWYDEEGNVYVAEDEAGAKALADNKQLTRDNDVLDTWFSSALWTFGTLGWPDETQTLKRHYPNDLLISGFDILFFWNASMVIERLEFLKEVPCTRLYLHCIVRAADGPKICNHKGNTV